MSLVVDAVCKRIGGLSILESVSLAVPVSGLTGLIGPNGAGKSTLFAIIGGTIPATSGEIRFDGKILGTGQPASRAAAGLIRTFQVPRPFRHLTVRQNLAAAAPQQSGETLLGALFGGAAIRRQETDIQARAADIISHLRLESVADVPAGRLSGGQRKLLEIGRALMLEPRTILLDEPFAGVNPVLIADIARRIVELNERGIGFFVVEHNIQALAQLVATMHVLDRGRLLASGTPKDVLSQTAVQVAYMGGAA